MIGGALSRGTRSGRWLAARIRVQSGRPWGVSRGMVVELFNSYAVGESKTHNHQHINTLTYILCGLITWLTVTRGHVTCITWQIHSFIHGSDNWSILSPWMRIISQKLFKTKRDSAGVRQETGKSYVGKSVWPACFSGCWSNIPTYISILNVCVCGCAVQGKTAVHLGGLLPNEQWMLYVNEERNNLQTGRHTREIQNGNSSACNWAGKKDTGNEIAVQNRASSCAGKQDTGNEIASQSF